MDFTRKFNFGLTLDTNLNKVDKFLAKYGQYIHSLYFSPPFGKQFHSRKKIAMQFMLPWKRRLFWQILQRARANGIEIELLLNTVGLIEADVKLAADGMARHGVMPDSVCFCQPYYQAVSKYFPTQKYIWSFNNVVRTAKEVELVAANYRVDAIVLGGCAIRNNQLFAHIKHTIGKQVYLLLNNACSFNCAKCGNAFGISCTDVFNKNRQTHSAEYLYALQSVFPCELYDGTINVADIYCFKLSTRSSDLTYAAKAIDSYTSGEVSTYVKQSKMNLALWGRVGYFWKLFSTMDFDEIVRCKAQILGHDVDLDGTLCKPAPTEDDR